MGCSGTLHAIISFAKTVLQASDLDSLSDVSASSLDLQIAPGPTVTIPSGLIYFAVIVGLLLAVFLVTVVSYERRDNRSRIRSKNNRDSACCYKDKSMCTKGWKNRRQRNKVCIPDSCPSFLTSANIGHDRPFIVLLFDRTLPIIISFAAGVLAAIIAILFGR